MKKILPLILAVFICFSFTTQNVNVYICNSTTASVYHSTKSCRGLGRCTHEIKEVSKEDAVKKYGRRACKVCY